MQNQAIVLALTCLLVAGVLDVVFKLYSRLPRSRGLLIFGVGVVWAVLHIASVTLFSAGGFVFDSPTLFYGAIAAVFVTVSNILLVESFTHLPVSLASTIYRLNTVPLVILAMLMLGEQLSLMELCGVLMAIAAVLVLHQRNPDSAYPRLFLGIIILASVMRASYGLTTKLGLQNGAHADTLILIGAIGWCIGGPVYALLRERHLLPVDRSVVGYSLGAGILVFGVVSLLTNALRFGDASVVVPISNMGFIAALGIAFAKKLETPTWRKALGVLGAVVAIILLSSGIA